MIDKILFVITFCMVFTAGVLVIQLGVDAYDKHHQAVKDQHVEEVYHPKVNAWEK